MPSFAFCARAAAAAFGLSFHLTAAADNTVFLATRDSAFSPDLLQELEAVVGRDQRQATEGRVARLERAMVQMYDSLPKDSNGRLGATGVRYMLRRLFVQRHGWFVHGLENGGESWNSSSPTDVFGQHLSESVENVFEERLQSHGFTLHHAAVLAATLESFVHAENLERLQAAFGVLGAKQDDATDAHVNLAMRAYMLMYMRGLNHSEVTQQQLKKTVRSARQALPFWERTAEFLEGTRQSVLEDDEDAAAAPTSWETNLKVLETIGERYGRWQDTECHEVKAALMKMEMPGTGRVPLERFYNSSWHFVESVDYLRLLGALDESAPSGASVIIPNYINGPNNCVSTSRFYSVCCIDECDTILSHLEDQIAAPAGQPGLIAQLVAALPSQTVEASRVLDKTLVQRLHDIAAHHNGEVPLHGRLFAQWMHHVYPRECSFPHMSGTTKPMTQEQYREHTGGVSVKATKEEMQTVVDQAQNKEVASSGSFAMWSLEEELFVGQPVVKQSFGASFIRMLVFCGVAVSMLATLVRSGRKAMGEVAGAPIDKCHYV